MDPEIDNFHIFGPHLDQNCPFGPKEDLFGKFHFNRFLSTYCALSFHKA